MYRAENHGQVANLSQPRGEKGSELTTGMETIQVLDHQPTDAVVIDLGLPDGLEDPGSLSPPQFRSTTGMGGDISPEQR
jgi:hypothetical protein